MNWFTEKMKFIDNQWRIISKDNGHSFTDFKDILHDYVRCKIKAYKSKAYGTLNIVIRLRVKNGTGVHINKKNNEIRREII